MVLLPGLLPIMLKRVSRNRFIDAVRPLFSNHGQRGKGIDADEAQRRGGNYGRRNAIDGAAFPDQCGK